jgi:hypothetical protein
MRLRIVLVLVACALAAAAQVSSTGSGSGGKWFSGSATFGGTAYAMPAVAGAPYSGEETSESVQTLADGTHITRKMPGRKVWRDAEGRTRSERSMFFGPDGTDSPVVIEIDDPVAGYRYTLETDRRIAHRVAMAQPPAMPPGGPVANTNMRAGASQMIASVPPPPPAGGAPAGTFFSTSGSGPHTAVARRQVAPMGGQAPDMKSERLGTRSFDGVLCEGNRMTVTIPVNAQGNDRPIVTMHESWFSPELKIQVFSMNSDPRSGENTFRIANLSRNQPDPNLFAVPPDYTVVDEKDPFTIHYSR